MLCTKFLSRMSSVSCCVYWYFKFGRLYLLLIRLVVYPKLSASLKKTQWKSQKKVAMKIGYQDKDFQVTELRHLVSRRCLLQNNFFWHIVTSNGNIMQVIIFYIVSDLFQTISTQFSISMCKVLRVYRNRALTWHEHLLNKQYFKAMLWFNIRNYSVEVKEIEWYFARSELDVISQRQARSQDAGVDHDFPNCLGSLGSVFPKQKIVLLKHA